MSKQEQLAPDQIALRSPEEIASIESAIKGILEGFAWSRSPQGHDYWSDVMNNLGALIGRDPGDY